MKKTAIALGLMSMLVVTGSLFSVSSAEWEKWQIKVQGNTTQSNGEFTVAELCHVKEYLSNRTSGLNEYIRNLKKIDNNSARAQLIEQLLSFLASLTKREKERFSKEIVVYQIRKMNPKANCL